MNTVKVPAFLQTLLGKRLSLLELVLAVMFSIGMTTMILIFTYSEWSNLEIWRMIILMVITVDHTIGIVANLLSSVNSHYLKNSKARLFFMILHLHPIVLALLYGSYYEISIAVWIYTILSTLLVKTITEHSSQRIISVVLAVSGVILLLLLFHTIPAIFLVILSLHMFKMIFCFAVDHDRK